MPTRGTREPPQSDYTQIAGKRDFEQGVQSGKNHHDHQQNRSDLQNNRYLLAFCMTLISIYPE
jgi:hypothetical protein